MARFDGWTLPQPYIRASCPMPTRHGASWTSPARCDFSSEVVQMYPHVPIRDTITTPSPRGWPISWPLPRGRQGSCFPFHCLAMRCAQCYMILRAQFCGLIMFALSIPLTVHVTVDLPPPKRRRTLAGSIVSTAMSAALIGTAVGLTVYRLCVVFFACLTSASRPTPELQMA